MNDDRRSFDAPSGPSYVDLQQTGLIHQCVRSKTINLRVKRRPIGNSIDTSRSKRDHETDGIDYHFVTKQRFEQDIVAGKFVEHGEFEKSIYGTSLDSIRSVVDTSKICILNLHPQAAEVRRSMYGTGPFARALKILKNSNLKPYFIFVCPPQLDRLRQQRTEAGELLKEEELREIIETGRAMKDAYGHFFDYVIIHYDHDRAYTELLNEINRIQTEPSWVPSSWLH